MNCVTEEVGIDEDVVWRRKGCVVLEEHVAGHLGRFADELAVDSLLRRLLLQQHLGLCLVLLQPGIAQAQDSLDLAELSGFLCDTHDGEAEGGTALKIESAKGDRSRYVRLSAIGSDCPRW